MGRQLSAETIKRIQSVYGFKTKKSLGQNFLADPGVISDIADACRLTEDSLALEIGPGLGVLTGGLAERAGKVCAVEIDGALIPILRDQLAVYDNVSIVNEDILAVDAAALIEEQRTLPGGRRLSHAVIAGNLPYYITTPIIMGLIEAGVPADLMVFMVQKEVADRMASGPGSKDYGVLSVSLQYFCEVKKILDVPSEAFIPSPKVDSAVVQLVPKAEGRLRAGDEALMMRIVKAGFAQRRKTLINALSGGGFEKERALAALEACGIDPSRRAETLSIEEFVNLSDRMSERI